MKKIHNPFTWKGIGCYPYFLSFLCLILWTPLQAQLPSGEQSMVEQAIENTTQQIPLLQPFLNAMNLGDPVVITNTASTFKFKKERLGVPFSTILNDLATAVGGTQLSSVLNNPVMTSISNYFTNNSITAEFTINNLDGTPNYSVSLLGAASGLQLEFFFGRGTGNTDFVFAIAPEQMNFGDIHTALSVFDGLAEPSVGIFLSKPGSEITPDMAIWESMGLGDFSLSNPLTAVANIQVNEDSEPGRLFNIRNMIATAQIPATISSPLTLTATLKPEWNFGPDASISDVTLALNAGISEGKVVIEQTASFTLDTRLPSDLTGNSKSDVSWTVLMGISGGPDESGIANFRVAGYGNMEGTWSTPFGINELDINSGGCELGINVELKVVPTPAGPVVTVSVVPDMALRGDINIGKTRAIKLALAGKLDLSAIYASGIYGHFTNLGLGTVLSELYLDKIGAGISSQDLASLDQVFVDYGKLSLFPAGAEIAGESYETGVGFSGRGKAFGLGCDINAFFAASGVYGELTIDPIQWKPNGNEVFSLRGVNPNDPLKAALNLQFNSLAAQFTDAFNGIPFLLVDAHIGLLGSFSQTKLVLNPIYGSYFSTNSKILDVLDVKMDGEAPSLLSFGDMKIRGALDKAPMEEFNRALIGHFDKTLKGLIPTEKIDELNNAISAKQAEINTMKQQVQDERTANMEQFNHAKDSLQGLQNQYDALTAQAAAKWAEHEALPWWDLRRVDLWTETTYLNGQRGGLLIALIAAQKFLDGLIWVSGLPPVDLDPRVVDLELKKGGLQAEMDLLLSLRDMGNSVSGVMRDLHGFFMANGIGNIVDVRQAEFQGNLNLLSGGKFDLMVNMIFMGQEISLTSKVGFKTDGSLDLSSLLNDLLNNRFTLGFSPSFSAEIGTKYNYSTSIATVNSITPPQNGNYVPPTTNPNPAPIGTAGNTVGLDTRAMTFNGTSDYQEKAGSWGNWTEMTIEAWVKSNGSNGGFQTIVSGNEGFVHFQMAPDGVGNNAVYLSNGLVILLPVLPDATTEWRHVAIVVKSGASKVYQNGELIGQPNYLGFGGATIIPTNNIRIGSNQTYGRYLNGDLADVRIWNKARTQTEIKAGMHEVPSMNTPGLVAAYIVDMVTPEVISQLEAHAQTFNSQTNITTPGHITQNLTAMTIEAWVKNEADLENIQAIVSSPELNFTHLQSSDDANVSSAVYVNTGEIYFPAVPKSLGQWQHVVMVVQSGNSQLYINGEPYGPHSTKTFSSINPAPIVQIGKGFQGSRAFNGKIANVRIWNSAKTPANLLANAQGSSPNNSNELLYFSPTSNPLSITSVNDCVPLPDDLAAGLIQSLTIEAWINNSSVQNDIQAILSADGPEFVHLQMSGDGNVNNAVYLNDGGSMMLPVIPALTPGWHHVALVVESGNTRVYLDAEQIGSTNTTAFTGLKPCPSVFIGKGWAGGRVFNGKIADVRIWKNRALTQSQIATYRHTPPPASANSLVYHYK